jgi:ABC-type glucose/galactose transport system permease subunit
MWCLCFDAGTHHPASFDSFVDSINGVCLQGFFSFVLGEVIFVGVLALAMIWMLLWDQGAFTNKILIVLAGPRSRPSRNMEYSGG